MKNKTKSTGPAPDDVETETVTKAEFARRVGVVRSMSNRYVQMGMPTTKDGRIPLQAGLKWHAAQIVPQLSGSWHHRQGKKAQAGGNKSQGRNPNASYHVARGVREVLRAKKEQIQYEAALGNLLPRKEIKAALSTLITDAKNRLLAMGSKLAPELENQSAITCQALLDSEIDEALRELLAWEPSNEH